MRPSARDPTPQFAQVGGDGTAVLAHTLGDLQVVSAVPVVTPEQGHRADVAHALVPVPVEALQHEHVPTPDVHETTSWDPDAAPLSEIEGGLLPGHDIPLVAVVRELGDEQPLPVPDRRLRSGTSQRTRARVQQDLDGGHVVAIIGDCVGRAQQSRKGHQPRDVLLDDGRPGLRRVGGWR